MFEVQDKTVMVYQNMIVGFDLQRTHIVYQYLIHQISQLIVHTERVQKVI